MDASSACGFFDLILGLFMEADIKESGKVVGMCVSNNYFSTFSKYLTQFWMKPIKYANVTADSLTCSIDNSIFSTFPTRNPAHPVASPTPYSLSFVNNAILLLGS